MGGLVGFSRQTGHCVERGNEQGPQNRFTKKRLERACAYDRYTEDHDTNRPVSPSAAVQN